MVLIRVAVAVLVAGLLAACSYVSSADPLSSQDQAFLQKFEELGGQVSEGNEQRAIQAGKLFCSELRSGSTQPQAHWAVGAKYPDVSRVNVAKAAAAANLIYCSDMLG